MQRGSILIIEDEAFIRMALADALEDEGYAVTEASNGLEAIGLLADPERIDAIITDVDMPGGISGLDIVRMIRLTGRSIPAIVVSGRIHDLDGCGVHAADFFLKPYRLEDVLRRLADLVPLKTNTIRKRA
jgi:CheY-like chemotaxis protein